MGISEVRWSNLGNYWTGDNRYIHIGIDNEYTGVEIPLNKECGNKVHSYFQYTDRIIMIEICTQPITMTIIQVYMWNAQVCEMKDGNNRGERLIEFCTEYKLVIVNTIFQKKKERRYT